MTAHGRGVEITVKAQDWGGFSRAHFWLGVMVEVLTEEVIFEVGLKGWENVFFKKNRKGSGHFTLRHCTNKSLEAGWTGVFKGQEKSTQTKTPEQGAVIRNVR